MKTAFLIETLDGHTHLVICESRNVAIAYYGKNFARCIVAKGNKVELDGRGQIVSLCPITGEKPILRAMRSKSAPGTLPCHSSMATRATSSRP